jgi:hypothetical protein
MKPAIIVIISVLLLFVQTGESAPLQKVQLKIEGLNKKALLRKVELALLSVPGVKTVEFRIKKRFFFKNYNEIQTFVEFELGTLTSETLIIAAESASDQKNIYKVKFVE